MWHLWDTLCVCVCVYLYIYTYIYTHYMYAHFHDIIIVGSVVFVNPNTFPCTDQLMDAKKRPVEDVGKLIIK